MEPATTSDSREQEPSAAIVRQAAEWLAHVESGDASAADHEDLRAWRAADPAHAVALDRLGGVRARLDGTPDVEREALRRLMLRPRRRAGASFLAVLVLIGAGWMASRLPWVQLYFADQKTEAGETRVVALPDGSSLTLSTDSAVNLEIGDGERAVRLLRGELLAHVAKADAPPFEVMTEDGTAIALGTAYTVLKESAATTVAVAQSQVRVCPVPEDDEGCLTLGPGQRARLAGGRAVRLPDVSAADVGAWAEGWLTVDDRPLAEVLDELNRWRAKPIGFDRTALADLRVSGIFPLRDTDRAAANLARLLPIMMDRSDPDAPVIRRR
ncbi:FecR family protein [Sphingomonas colocasiae]|uniref:FecR domain-containing protein n=1 Tax=Sphingomonas colocasiae TaxID=1848973 RepID=A0ABS7PQP7_9SPHN|nr:FecR domain-containing protein [Sphingomonas colocasiae]MBY8823670.1 FecR domain-containing protein [Sphingomonas colocasiae]